MSGILGTSSRKSGIIGRSQDTAKAWVNFNGTGTLAIRDSFNVSSVTDNGTGDYSTNFRTNMQNDKYVVVSGCGNNAASTSFANRFEAYSRAVGTFRALNYAYNASAAYDREVCYHIVFGD